MSYMSYMSYVSYVRSRGGNERAVVEKETSRLPKEANGTEVFDFREAKMKRKQGGTADDPAIVFSAHLTGMR